MVGGVGMVPVGPLGLRRDRRRDLHRHATRDFRARTAGRWRARPAADGFYSLRAVLDCDLPALRVSIGESHWSALGHYPIFIQTSRAPLYAGYFLAGVAVGAASLRKGVLDEGGAIARRWRMWLAIALAGYAAILLLVYIHRSGMIDLRSPPLWWHAAYGITFALFGAAMTFTVPAFFLRFAKTPFRFLDAMQKQAYGIYLLHFIPLIWLQYLVFDPPWPAFIKFAIVFAGTLSASWLATMGLRKIPIVARMI